MTNPVVSGSIEKTFEKKIEKFQMVIDKEVITVTTSGRKFSTMAVLRKLAEGKTK